MKKLWKMLLPLLIGTMMLSMLAGCDSGDGAGDESENAGGPPVDIVAGGVTDYTIVRSDFKDTGSDETKGALLLRKAIMQVTGADITITTDWDDKSDYSARAEILVGSTNRELSARATEGLSKKEFRILFEGNKIAIAGGSETAVLYGVEYFVQTYLPGYTEGAEAGSAVLAIPEGLDYRQEYVLVIKAQGEGDLPRIVQTKYETDDIVVADYIVTEAPYNADATGEKDATTAIQRALDAASSDGGGTVYMPAGKYLVTGDIMIPDFVTLRGDWQDPDSGNIKSMDDYGTLILAKVPSSDSRESGLFVIGGSAGVKGVTVYYPDQDINNVKPYPYTFYIHGRGNGYHLQSVEDCTVINGYNGVATTIMGDTAHEMLTIDTLKGTFLHVGAELFNSADVGTSKNIWFSNSYWANAPAEINPPAKADIDAYTREGGIGMIIGDLEWTQFSNVRISDYMYGIHVVSGFRIQFAGAFYDLQIANTKVGVQVDNIDTRWGMNIAYSTIQGSEYAIVNNTGGMIKMTDVTTDGELGGKQRFYRIENDQLDAYAIKDYNAQPVKPAEVLYVFDGKADQTIDIGEDLQLMLDTVAAQGGGIVYLKAGIYLMNTPITVPAGVQLRGAGSLPTRDQNTLSAGTLILTDYGRNDEDPDNGRALVTLETEAGVRNVRFLYMNNSPESGKINKYNYTIRGVGDRVYTVNVAIGAAYNGVDFRGCNDFMIKKLVSCCYENDMRVGDCRGGLVEGCLHNATVMLRGGYVRDHWGAVDSFYSTTFDQITRPYTKYFIAENCEDVLYYNSFAYGVRSLVVAENTKNLRVINVGADNIGGYMVEFTGGDATVINMMRYNCESYLNNDCSLAIYNRLSINEKKEDAVKERK